MFSRQKKSRFFIYSEKHLGYKEVRFFRTKLVSSLFMLTVFSLGVLLAVNHYYIDFLGLGYNRIQTLTKENQILKQELKRLEVQMADVERTLDFFGERTNELRLLVDLPRVAEDVRRAGIGGRAAERDFGVPSADAQELLNRSTTLLDKISREVHIQKTSYEEIYKKYEFNKEYFARIPALKPMEGYYSPAGFGLRMHPVLGIYKTHEGLDIIADVGTRVYASGDGVVDYAMHSGGGYGNVVLVSHGYGYQSLYAHLSKILVKEGQKVRRGDLIALSGKTGLVSGPHLHYEIRHRGVKKNPIDFFMDDVLPREYKSMLVTMK
jgi:murein DD-endopeptidase MepM/ murein hydrolase activator NlpD